MEKNTLLAVIMAVVVFIGYDSYFVAPKRAQMAKEAQMHAMKQVKTEDKISTPTTPIIVENEQVPTSSSEIITKSGIKTTSIDSNFSNVGGTLHNVNFLPESKTMPISPILDIGGYEMANFKLVSTDHNAVVYRFTDSNWQITKKFEAVDDHLMKATIDIKNITTMSKLTSFRFKTTGIDSSRLENLNGRDTMLDEYSVYANNKIVRKGGAFKFKPKEEKSAEGQVEWTAFRDHYLALIVKPEFKTKGYDIKYVADNKLNVFVNAEEGNIAPGQTVSYAFSIFAGPQDLSLLKKYNQGFDKIIAFFNWGFLNAIAMLIYHIMPFLHSIFRSWGITIIAFSIIIYGLTYPLTIKSMMSMRKMQAVQPKIAALREKYKNDPTKLNAEMIDIYRRENINPLGGCLPFILQMPIFIALYPILWRAQYFQGQGFLWIKDLALPDRLFIMPFTLPFLGNNFNILPILMAIIMFFQQKLSAKNMVVTDEAQLMQQKMMTMIFPFFIGFMFYNFASSLSLYFTMFYLLSTITQWKMTQVKAK